MGRGWICFRIAVGEVGGKVFGWFRGVVGGERVGLFPKHVVEVASI